MHKKEKGERFLPKINYIRIAMYKYLVSLQRYAIYSIQQKFLSKKTLQLLSGQALNYHNGANSDLFFFEKAK